VTPRQGLAFLIGFALAVTLAQSVR
jgi:hypothetical protein